jgi:AraC-like DNA-binding protein
MHKLHCANPSPALQAFVRTYAEREFEGEDPIWTPVPARLEQMINFEFGDPILVSSNDGHLELHSSSVIGPQTEGGSQALLSGKMHSFAIFFQPSGLSKLFGCPMSALTNQAWEASAVIGGWLANLQICLAELPTFELRVQLVEKVLTGQAAAIHAKDRMMDMADRILAMQGVLSIRDIAAEYGLSLRQFERRFKAVTGMSPKLCARIARFQSALDAKIAHPERTWLAIAHDLNFHDQMHMIHDFRSLAGDSPGGILSRLSDQRPPALLVRGQFHDMSA